MTYNLCMLKDSCQSVISTWDTQPQRMDGCRLTVRILIPSNALRDAWHNGALNAHSAVIEIRSAECAAHQGENQSVLIVDAVALEAHQMAQFSLQAWQRLLTFLNSSYSDKHMRFCVSLSRDSDAGAVPMSVHVQAQYALPASLLSDKGATLRFINNQVLAHIQQAVRDLRLCMGALPYRSRDGRAQAKASAPTHQ